MEAENDFKYDPSGKIRIVDQPYVAPSKCVLCGIGHNEDGKRHFIDTQTDLDWYGTIYICTTCFKEVANAIGYLSPKQYTEVRDNAVENKAENIGLKVENDSLRTALGLLTNHRCFKPVDSSHLDQYKAEREEPAVLGDAVESGEPEGSDNAEPDDGKGLSDVRGNAASDATEHGKPASAKRRSGSILDDLV